MNVTIIKIAIIINIAMYKESNLLPVIPYMTALRFATDLMNSMCKGLAASNTSAVGGLKVIYNGNLLWIMRLSSSSSCTVGSMLDLHCNSYAYNSYAIVMLIFIY